MDQKEVFVTNKPPLFTGVNFSYWSVRMRCYLMSLGWNVWEATEKEHNIGNAKALNSILNGLTDSVFTKVMQCTSAKQAWDKLKIIYEG